MASYSPGFVSLLTSQTREFSTPGFVNLSGDEEVAGARPPGIKAAKAAKKKKGVQEESNHTELRTVLEMKDKLNKPDPLSEMEMSLKLKLITEESNLLLFSVTGGIDDHGSRAREHSTAIFCCFISCEL
ncbi:hypothetical protein F2Q68_00036762 [Brassica cretica]|uniref:No apical meristem-associated C-terminal domain-containing protein n=1 Tax=Brassica cretica TaxID=69181 RepID=A0A8S9HBR5_BRACR|nr:hypothetical protein F2Q68_00036762 [Brassica cretica]